MISNFFCSPPKALQNNRSHPKRFPPKPQKISASAARLQGCFSMSVSVMFYQLLYIWKFAKTPTQPQSQTLVDMKMTLPTITHNHHPSTTQTQCQQYFSYYWHEFDQTFQVTLVRTTFVLAAFALPELKSMTLFWPKVKATVVLVTFVLPLWTKILLTPAFSVNQIFLTKHFLYPSKIQKQNTKTGNTGFLYICN